MTGSWGPRFGGSSVRSIVALGVPWAGALNHILELEACRNGNIEMAIDSLPPESHERMVREEWEDVALNLESMGQDGFHLSQHSHCHHLLPANYLATPWNPKPKLQENEKLIKREAKL